MKQLFAFLALSISHFAYCEWQDFPHTKVRLIADHQYAKTGDNVRVGWQFQLEEGWHLYWQNPGDTGLAPAIDWGQESATVGKGLLWAKPESIPLGPFINYGYHGDVLIAETFTLQKSVQQKNGIKFNASINWLVCKEACIPGEAQETLHIARNTTQPSPWLERFEQLETNIPIITPLLGGDFTVQADTVSAVVYAQSNIFASAKNVKVFPITQNLIEYNHKPELSWRNNVLRWKTKRSEYFTSTPKTIELVVIINDKDAYQFTLRG